MIRVGIESNVDLAISGEVIYEPVIGIEQVKSLGWDVMPSERLHDSPPASRLRQAT